MSQSTCRFFISYGCIAVWVMLATACSLPTSKRASGDTRPQANTPEDAVSTHPDQWIGRWTGPEGLFLQIMPTSMDDHYRLTLKDNLDTQAQYDAVARDGVLHFTRDGTEQTIRPGIGRQTGFSDLFEQTDCLIVIAGTEGYCRSPDMANALPLKRGTYVARSASCADPSFADLQFYNGRGFAGAHSRACRSTVVDQNGLSFTLDNSCIDAGTGPAPRSTVREKIIVEDDEHYSIKGDTGPSVQMQYCAPAKLPASLRTRVN